MPRYPFGGNALPYRYVLAYRDESSGAQYQDASFSFKQRQIFLISCLETFCEFCSIIRLNFMYLEWETAGKLPEKAHGRAGGLFLACSNKAKTRTFINRRIPVHLLSLLLCLSDNAGRGNDFDIDLYLLSGEGCLLVWFWLIYRFLGLACFKARAFHAAIKTCYGTSITLFA